MPKPSETPRWADLADPADIATPTSTARDSGWKARIRPPHEWVNWFWNLCYEWVLWLSEVPPRYTSMSAAIDDIAEEQLVLIDEGNSIYYPGASLDDAAAGTIGQRAYDLCSTGKYLVYIAPAGMPTVVDREDIDTAVSTLAGGTIAAGGLRVFTEGTHVYYISGNKIACWTISTGAFVWEYDHGAAINDGCVYNGRVFIVGAAGTGTKHLRALLYDTGAVSWSYNHNGELRAVAAAQGRVFVGGAASGHASGAHMRSVVDSSGADLANEGGNGVDASGRSWDIVRAVAPDYLTFTTDGRSLFAVWPVGQPYQLEAIDLWNGSVSRGRVLTAGLSQPTCDVDYVLAVDAAGISVFDRRSLDVVTRVIDTDATSVDSDGGAIFYGRLLPGNGSLLGKAQRLNRPTLYRKTALASGKYARVRALVRALTPEE